MRTPVLIQLTLLPWLAVSLIVGELRILQSMPPVVVPLLLWAITGVFLIAYFRSHALRYWINQLDLRWLVAIHLTRFVGVYFLILYRRGELPQAFAVPGGVGDSIVALAAFALIALPLASGHRRRAIAIWNAMGLVDIVFVVMTAARLNLADPAQMRALTYLPLSLLPLFIVPLLITTHVILFLRTRHPSHESRQPDAIPPGVAGGS